MPFIMRAQQDPQFSHNMFNFLTVNPAYSSVEDGMVASVINRQQWVGFDNAPVTTVVNFSMPFRFAEKRHGIGMTIVQDKLGMEKNTAVRFAYSFRKELNNGSLNFGASFGIQNNSMKGDWYVPDALKGKGELPGGSIDDNKMVFDPSLGVFYSSDNLYAGASVQHVTKPEVSYNQNVKTYLARHYYLTAGYKLELNNWWEIAPSFFYKTDAVVSQIDINALVTYNKKFLGGVSYRIDDAIVGMLGVKFNNGIQVSYAYDISTSKIAKGSHEFFLAYRFKTKFDKKKQKYKSIRFL